MAASKHIRVRRWEDFCRPMELVAKLKWFAAVAADPELNSTEKLVAAALGLIRHNSDTGCLIPSYGDLAETLGGISESTIERAVAGLVERGWIEKGLLVDRRGMTSGNVFRLVAPPSGSKIAATVTASSLPPETSPAPPLRHHSCGLGDSTDAVHNQEEKTKKRKTGQGTNEGKAFDSFAVRPAASGADAPSLPATLETNPAREEENTAGLRVNSAAPAPAGSAFDLPPGMNPPGMSHLARRPGESEADYRLRISSALAYPSRDPLSIPTADLGAGNDQDDDLERRLLAMVQPAT